MLQLVLGNSEERLFMVRLYNGIINASHQHPKRNIRSENGVFHLILSDIRAKIYSCVKEARTSERERVSERV